MDRMTQPYTRPADYQTVLAKAMVAIAEVDHELRAWAEDISRARAKALFPLRMRRCR